MLVATGITGVAVPALSGAVRERYFPVVRELMHANLPSKMATYLEKESLWSGLITAKQAKYLWGWNWMWESGFSSLRHANDYLVGASNCNQPTNGKNLFLPLVELVLSFWSRKNARLVHEFFRTIDREQCVGAINLSRRGLAVGSLYRSDLVLHEALASFSDNESGLLQLKGEPRVLELTHYTGNIQDEWHKATVLVRRDMHQFDWLMMEAFAKSLAQLKRPPDLRWVHAWQVRRNWVQVQSIFKTRSFSSLLPEVLDTDILWWLLMQPSRFTLENLQWYVFDAHVASGVLAHSVMATWGRCLTSQYAKHLPVEKWRLLIAGFMQNWLAWPWPKTKLRNRVPVSALRAYAEWEHLVSPDFWTIWEAEAALLEKRVRVLNIWALSPNCRDDRQLSLKKMMKVLRAVQLPNYKRLRQWPECWWLAVERRFEEIPSTGDLPLKTVVFDWIRYAVKINPSLLSRKHAPADAQDFFAKLREQFPDHAELTKMVHEVFKEEIDKLPRVDAIVDTALKTKGGKSGNRRL